VVYCKLATILIWCRHLDWMANAKRMHGYIKAHDTLPISMDNLASRKDR
jgi:hypothetical protein